jgi:hypothetical protein
MREGNYQMGSKDPGARDKHPKIVIKKATLDQVKLRMSGHVKQRTKKIQPKMGDQGSSHIKVSQPQKNMSLIQTMNRNVSNERQSAG